MRKSELGCRWRPAAAAAVVAAALTLLLGLSPFAMAQTTLQAPPPATDTTGITSPPPKPPEFVGKPYLERPQGIKPSSIPLGPEHPAIKGNAYLEQNWQRIPQDPLPTMLAVMNPNLTKASDLLGYLALLVEKPEDLQKLYAPSPFGSQSFSYKGKEPWLEGLRLQRHLKAGTYNIGFNPANCIPHSSWHQALNEAYGIPVEVSIKNKDPAIGWVLSEVGYHGIGRTAFHRFRPTIGVAYLTNIIRTFDDIGLKCTLGPDIGRFDITEEQE